MIYGDRPGFSDLAQVVERATDALSEHQDRFDSIVVTGVSGIVVGAPVSVLMGKALVVVRKPDDMSTHSFFSVENILQIGNRYLFLDDFILTGSTEKRVESIIHHRVKMYDIESPKYIGRYEYDKNRLTFY